MKEGSFTGDFEREVRFCFYQGMCKRRLWKQASLSIGAPLGNLGGVCLLGTLKWRMCKEGSRNGYLSPWGPHCGTWRGANLPGTWGARWGELWKWACVSIGVLFREHGGDAHCPGTLREGWDFSVRRTFTGESKRRIKEGSENGKLSP